MGILQNMSNFVQTVGRKRNIFKMMTVANESNYIYNGRIYESDIVRSCLRPYVKGLGKIVGKHIRESILADGTREIQTNPDAYMRFLLEEPNPYMTFQKLTEKMAVSLKLNNNAFALIVRDDNGIPRELYPMPANGAMTEWLKDGSLGVRFYVNNGTSPIFRYSDIIHIRGDFYDHDILGDPIAPALIPLMECVGTIDKGIINAIKNSGIIRWLLNISGGVRDEDLKRYAENFAKNYLSIENASSLGVAAVDAKADAKQIEPKDYVPNASIIDRQKERIYEIFNTNKEIVQSKENGDSWNSYFEHEIEPDIRQFSDEFTRKLFSRHQRAFGNRIIFEAVNLTHASFETKMELQAMVDRGAMTPNEWREVFNLAPIDGGDQAIRRLDTAVVNQIKNLANRIQGKDHETDCQLIATINRLIDGRVEPGKEKEDGRQLERIAANQE